MSGVNIKRYKIMGSSPGAGSFNQSPHDKDSFAQAASASPVAAPHNVISTGQQTSNVYNPVSTGIPGQMYPEATVLANAIPYSNNLNASYPAYTQQNYNATMMQPMYQSTPGGTFSTQAMREYNPQIDRDARIVGENVIEINSRLPARIVREEPVEFVKEIVREIPREYIQRTVFQEPVTYIREVTYDEPVLVMEQVVEREPYAYYKRTVENVPGGQRIFSSSGTGVAAGAPMTIPNFQASTPAYPGMAPMAGGYQVHQPMPMAVQGSSRVLPLREVNQQLPTPAGELRVSQPPASLMAARGTFGQQLYSSENARLNSSRG